MAIMPLGRRENKRDSDRERDSNENPWTEIVGTVRKVDEDKVKDCTDDIDTLLVFAGLYSAVLTAFLIESYKNLFADESESLLRQMVHQTANYQFTNGYLNSTFDPSQLPSFKAAVSDIRVNVCWFASLILSLASASFGIAVKQWLREFLSIDYISPQERLRIRDARIHGLRDWKLFQIAAFLPILLQISLVLFFVGLCFFTAAVHPSIGTTSLFLVSCWAFLFFMSVLAPLFSPRCPYKTTILKVPFRYARPHIRAFLGLEYRRLLAPSHKATPVRDEQAEVLQADSDPEDVLTNTIGSVHSQPSVSLASPVGAAWLRLCAAFDNTIQRIRFTREAVTVEEAQPPSPSSEAILSAPPRSAFSLLACIRAHLPRRLRGRRDTRAGSASPQSEDSQDDSKELQYHDDYMDLEMLSELLSDVVVQDTIPEEEDVIRRTNHNDLIIFHNIDCDFFDDNLLARLPGALSQRPPPLRDVLRFVKTIIHHRIGSSLPTTAAVTTWKREPWPWTLSYSARSALVDMLAKTMEYELHRGSKDWKTLGEEDSEWTRSFILLTSLVSTHEATFPSSIMSLFDWANEHYSDGACNLFDLFSYQMRAPAASYSEWPARSLLFLARSLETLKAEDAAKCLAQTTYNTFIQPIVAWKRDVYHCLLERDPSDDDGDVIAPTPQRIVALLEVARVILRNAIAEQQAQDSFPEYTCLLLEFVFDAIPRINNLPDAGFDKPLTGTSDERGLYRVLTELFTTPHTTRPLLRFLVINPRFLSSSSPLNEWFFLGLVGSAGDSSRKSDVMVLAACTEFFKTESTSTSSIVDSPAALLRLCLLIYQFGTRAEYEFIACWKTLFAAIYECYKRIIQHKPHSGLGIVTCRYVNSDDRHSDTCDTAYAILNVRERWMVDHQFPDEMVNFLRTFVCPSHTFSKYGHKLSLIRRLEEIEEAAVAEAAASKKPFSSFVEDLGTGFEEAGSTISDPANDTAILATPTPDERPHEQSASPNGESVLRDPVAAEDALLGAAILSIPKTPAQGAALGSTFGLHDLGECVPTDSPRFSSLKLTADTDPQSLYNTETIDGASETHSTSKWKATPSDPSAIRKDLSFVDAPQADELRAVDSQATVLDTSPTVSPDMMTADHTPDIAGLGLPSVVPLSDDDDALDGDVPKPRIENVEQFPPTSRAVNPTAVEDAATVLLDVLGGVDSGGDVAGSSEGVITLETSSPRPSSQIRTDP